MILCHNFHRHQRSICISEALRTEHRRFRNLFSGREDTTEISASWLNCESKNIFFAVVARPAISAAAYCGECAPFVMSTTHCRAKNLRIRNSTRQDTGNIWQFDVVTLNQYDRSRYLKCMNFMHSTRRI